MIARYLGQLWPNLVFLRDGAVVRQLARPAAFDLREAFAALMGQPAHPR